MMYGVHPFKQLNIGTTCYAWLETVSQNKICDQSNRLVNELTGVNQTNICNIGCWHKEWAHFKIMLSAH